MSSPDFPLFPLSMFVLPGQRTRLQIFEPRYLDMISQRMKLNAGFGVVQIRDGREVGRAPLFFPVGTEVAITDWTQQTNGLLGIEIEGRRRFRVLRSEVQRDQLVLADVEWLPLEPVEPVTETYEGLHTLLMQLREHPSLQGLNLSEADSLSQLGWQLSLLLPLSTPEKMALWEMVSPVERLESIAQQVQRLTRD